MISRALKASGKLKEVSDTFEQSVIDNIPLDDAISPTRHPIRNST